MSLPDQAPSGHPLPPIELDTLDGETLAPAAAGRRANAPLVSPDVQGVLAGSKFVMENVHPVCGTNGVG